MMALLSLLDEFHWLTFFRFGADILLVYYLIYRILLLVRGRRAGRMLLGMGIIVFMYLASVSIGLPTLNWILGKFLGSLILVIVVLFQDELRRGFIKVGLMPSFNREETIQGELTIKAISRAAYELSNRRVGALIVVQREVGLEEYTESAIQLDAQVSHQLIVSIFVTASPLHDGALVVAGDRLVAAGAVLPLTFNPELSSSLGTRHRAAFGISERTDAVVIVVSEETGTISLVREGKITRDLNESTLYSNLHRVMVSSIKQRELRRRKLQKFFKMKKSSGEEA